MSNSNKKLETRSIHSGERTDPATGAVIPPIYQTSTFVLNGPGETKNGYDYSRSGNPTRTVLEEKLAAVENGRFGLCFASGMAAINNVLTLLKTGDHIVSESNVYGGTHRLFTHLLPKYGIDVTFVDFTDENRIQEAIRDETRLLWLETPTNPLLKIIDIKNVSRIAGLKGAVNGAGEGILVVVDNTFAPPYIQYPLELGADIIIHSTTKYLGGHSDVVGGAVITSNEDVYKELAFFQNACGAVPGQFDSWLISRSIKTLSLRLKKHCENALKVAQFLDEHPGVAKVYYPGLPDHPQHELAKEQMGDFGGIVSFELDGGIDEIKRFLGGLEYFKLAVSLGAVESLIAHPATMTHAAVPREDRLKAGLSDGLLRLSVGLEDADDLLRDLGTALDGIKEVEK